MSEIKIAKKEKKNVFAGMGAFVQLIGVLLCLTIAGAIIGIPLFIMGSNMSKKLLCSNCGNQTTKESKICAACHYEFA